MRPVLPLLLLLLAWAAVAQERPRLVLVLESSDPATTAGELRAQLSRALRVPVGPLTSDRPERLLIVRLAPEGPAHVRIEARGRPPRSLTIPRSDEPGWLARGLSEALQASLVDWHGRPRPVEPVHLADWDEREGPSPAAESAQGLDPPPR